MRKKKIIHIVEAFGGGVFSYICDLTNNLSDEFETYIAYSLRNQTPENFKDYFNNDIKLIELKNFERSVNMVKDMKALFEIKKIIKIVKPDLIHLHSSKAGVIGRIAFGRLQIPTFYTPHGYSFLMEDQNPLNRFIYKFIEIACNSISKTITISCSIGEHKESLKVCKRTKYVNNGVDIHKLDSMVSKLKIKKNEKITVVTLGRICFQKNPELFNEIALSMPNVDFIWIGDGERKCALNAPNIHITGWLEREEALEYAYNSDIFVLTSLWEGLPISLLEAMYMKKFCVVSDVIGNHDVIKSGENGFVCNDVSDYIDAINIFSENKALTNKIINNAKRDILNIYNTDEMSKEYRSIYKNALNFQKKN